jgi:hypothetical protein
MPNAPPPSVRMRSNPMSMMRSKTMSVMRPTTTLNVPLWELGTAQVGTDSSQCERI